MSNEEKWRRDFEKLNSQYKLDLNSEGNYSDSIIGRLWKNYLAARKTAQIEFDELQEVIRSCNERNRLLVEAGWKNVMAIEERDQEIERLRTRAMNEIMGEMKTNYQEEIERLGNEIAMIDGASKDEIERLKKELHAYQGRENLAYDLMGELKERDELLLEGVKYMREGHLKFTPTVTSSLVLDWIEKVNKILGEQ